jgi:hypothetical protein
MRHRLARRGAERFYFGDISGHRNLFDGPAAFERHLVQEAQSLLISADKVIE